MMNKPLRYVGIALLAAVAFAAISGSERRLAASQAGVIEGTVNHPKQKGNMVVFVTQASGTFTPPSKHAVIDQRGMKFIPFLTPIVIGTTVDFLNSDNVQHNVFSPDNEGFNLGTYAPNEKRSYTFNNEGIYTILCSIHPEMEAYVLSLQNSYFARVAKSGKFRIAGVPDGSYQLRVFGKKLKKSERKRDFDVVVSNGKADISIDFTQ